MTSIILDSFRHFRNKKASQMGAAISYYMIFALIPLSLVVVSVAGFVFGVDIAESAFITQINNLVGGSASDFISSGLSELESKNFTFFSISLLVITMIFATVQLLNTLNESLDTLWELRPKKESDFGARIQKSLSRQFITFSILPIFTLLFIFLISASIFSNIYLHSSWISSFLFFLFSCIFFIFVYGITPFRSLPLRELIFGGIVTSFLFIFGRILIGFYIDNVVINSVLSGFGSLVVLLVWIYYSAQVFFLGASITYVYSKKYGSLKK